MDYLWCKTCNSQWILKKIHIKRNNGYCRKKRFIQGQLRKKKRVNKSWRIKVNRPLFWFLQFFWPWLGKEKYPISRFSHFSEKRESYKNLVTCGYTFLKPLLALSVSPCGWCVGFIYYTWFTRLCGIERNYWNPLQRFSRCKSVKRLIQINLKTFRDFLWCGVSFLFLFYDAPTFIKKNERERRCFCPPRETFRELLSSIKEIR